mmetsp:Transcript_34567/g.81440  ORF Transcript_34567/g.81440 Transcript_34567/m.81440 type:complete len:114 (+) Transcript_34567:317-658(+)
MRVLASGGGAGMRAAASLCADADSNVGCGQVETGKALRAQLERRDKAMEELKAKHSREIDEIMLKSSQIVQMNAALKSKVEEFNRREALRHQPPSPQAEADTLAEASPSCPGN